MKRIISILLSLVMLLSLSAFAEATPGVISLCNLSVSVGDTTNDFSVAIELGSSGDGTYAFAVRLNDTNYLWTIVHPDEKGLYVRFPNSSETTYLIPLEGCSPVDVNTDLSELLTGTSETSFFDAIMTPEVWATTREMIQSFVNVALPETTNVTEPVNAEVVLDSEILTMIVQTIASFIPASSSILPLLGISVEDLVLPEGCTVSCNIALAPDARECSFFAGYQDSGIAISLKETSLSVAASIVGKAAECTLFEGGLSLIVTDGDAQAAALSFSAVESGDLAILEGIDTENAVTVDFSDLFSDEVLVGGLMTDVFALMSDESISQVLGSLMTLGFEEEASAEEADTDWITGLVDMLNEDGSEDFDFGEFFGLDTDSLTEDVTGFEDETDEEAYTVEPIDASAILAYLPEGATVTEAYLESGVGYIALSLGEDSVCDIYFYKDAPVQLIGEDGELTPVEGWVLEGSETYVDEYGSSSCIAVRNGDLCVSFITYNYDPGMSEIAAILNGFNWAE